MACRRSATIKSRLDPLATDWANTHNISTITQDFTETRKWKRESSFTRLCAVSERCCRIKPTAATVSNLKPYA